MGVRMPPIRPHVVIERQPADADNVVAIPDLHGVELGPQVAMSNHDAARRRRRAGGVLQPGHLIGVAVGSGPGQAKPIVPLIGRKGQSNSQLVGAQGAKPVHIFRRAQRQGRSTIRDNGLQPGQRALCAQGIGRIGRDWNDTGILAGEQSREIVEAGVIQQQKRDLRDCTRPGCVPRWPWPRRPVPA